MLPLPPGAADPRWPATPRLHRRPRASSKERSDYFPTGSPAPMKNRTASCTRPSATSRPRSSYLRPGLHRSALLPQPLDLLDRPDQADPRPDPAGFCIIRRLPHGLDTLAGPVCGRARPTRRPTTGARWRTSSCRCAPRMTSTRSAGSPGSGRLLASRTRTCHHRAAEDKRAAACTSTSCAMHTLIRPSPRTGPARPGASLPVRAPGRVRTASSSPAVHAAHRAAQADEIYRAADLGWA